MRVQVPAKIEAYDTGIKNFDGLRLNWQHMLMTTGINRTTTGVLFTKAETMKVWVKMTNRLSPAMQAVELHVRKSTMSWHPNQFHENIISFNHNRSENKRKWIW